MKLFVWGYNYYNQLGLDLPGSPAPLQTITQSPTGDEWATVSAGNAQTFGIKTDGTLWACGYGGSGALGLGGVVSSKVFIQVGTDTDWAKVFGGNDRAFAIKTDGTLWAWGYASSYSVLGLGSSTDMYSPTQVGSSDLWTDIAQSGYHALGLRSDGTVWSWGSNVDGELGHNDTTTRTTPTQITSISGATKISAGGDHSHIVTSDGKLYGFGNNSEYQLGISSSTADRLVPTQVGSDTNWTDIKGGTYHSLAKKSTGEIYSTGRNQDGQLGLGDFAPRTAFTRIGIRTDWSKIHCGFYAGGHTSFAIDTTGNIYGWGYNGYYELNNGSTADVSSPLLVGSIYSGWDIVVDGGGAVLALLPLEDDFWTNFRSQTEIHL